MDLDIETSESIYEINSDYIKDLRLKKIKADIHHQAR